MQPAAPVSVNHEYMTKRLHILVVEDNAGDFILIEQMLLWQHPLSQSLCYMHSE
jgi:hypothetical protein